MTSAVCSTPPTQREDNSRIRGQIVESLLEALRRHEHHQESLLRVQAILRLVEHDRLRAVDDLRQDTNE